ncbi:MAG: bile acid:sodium symporter family protein, partial [Clostridia bacterium]|nr:bile acid:sodium symporter family protein [Clostridia bacterium]
MKKISGFVGRYMAILVLAVAALALFLPESCLWIQTSWINGLLMLVMFGMGLTLKFDDFAIVFSRPRDMLIGCVAQFTVMPALAYFLGKLFGLDSGLLAGVVLVGACPGGTSSNVMTYLSRGDVALSVGMTSVNTLLAPFLTPAITYLMLRTSVSVDVLSMFISIVQVVIIPVVLGFLINRVWGEYTKRVADSLPLVSVAAITLIVAAVVSHNAERIRETGAVVFVVVILHNVLGYLAGYGIGVALHLPVAKQRAVSIERGMQNTGLSSSLANSAFSTLGMA